MSRVFATNLEQSIEADTIFTLESQLANAGIEERLKTRNNLITGGRGNA